MRNVTTPLSRRSIALLELHALQWRGIAWQLEHKLKAAKEGTPEYASIVDTMADALMEAERCEQEINRRREKRNAPAAAGIAERVTEKMIETACVDLRGFMAQKASAPKTTAEIVIGPWPGSGEGYFL